MGLFAFHYGSIPRGYHQSITELEFREATKRGLRRLIFMVPDDVSEWPPRFVDKRGRMSRLRTELIRQDGFCMKPFKDRSELLTLVPQAIKELVDGLPDVPTPRKDTFRDFIEPLSFEVEEKRHLNRFTGRQWVEAKLDEWITDKRDSKAFCLMGGPGIGKSAIACHWCHSRKDVIAFHYCVFGYAERTDPKRILLSLAAQIAEHLPEYEKRLSALSIDKVKLAVTADTRVVFDNLFLKLLSGDFPTPGRTLLIVIDGLDEASRGQDNELANFIGEVWGGLPDWLRLVVTSRQELDVMSYIANLRPFILNASSRENLQDIHAFLKRELAAENASDQIIDEVVEKSEGMFLYANLVVDEIHSGRLSLSNTSEFPEGLTGYYKGWFKRKFSQVEAYRRDFHDLVSVIVAQRAPLPLPVLGSVLALGSNELDRRLMWLGVLFPLRTDGQGNQEVTFVTLMHKSLLDWLTERSGYTHRPKAGEFAADPALGNRLLAEEGWKVYSAGRLAQHPYFSQTLLAHLTQAQQPDKLASVLLDPVLVDTLWSDEFRYEWQRHISQLAHTVSLADLVRQWLVAHASPGERTSQYAATAVRLCWLFQELGAFDEAISLAEAALRIWHANHVADCPDMLRAFLVMGKIQFLQEQLDRATVSYEKALTITQRAYAPDSQKMADVLYELCVFYTQGKRDYKKASECLEKCYSIRRRQTPPDYAGMANCINDRAVILEAEGKTADYLAMYREALELFKKGQPEGHPEMVATLGNIGNALCNQRKQQEAIEALRKAVAMSERILLPQHEYVSFARTKLASILLAQGKYDEALKTMRFHVEELERFPGPDHNDTAAARARLCEYLCQTVNLASSGKRDSYREEIRQQCQRIRKAEPATVLHLLFLAEHSRRAAEPTLRDCLQDAALGSCRCNTEGQHANPSDSVSAKCFSDTLQTLMSDKPLSELAPEVLSLWEGVVPLIEHEADCLPKTRRSMVDLLAWTGRTRLAKLGRIADVHEAFDLITRIGAESPDTLDQLASLTACLYHCHHEDVSEALCQRLVEKSERIVGPEHVQTLRYLQNFAFLKMCRGSLEEAERLYRRAFQGRLENGGCQQAHTLGAIGSLAECLLLRGSTDAARNLIREFVPKLPALNAAPAARKALVAVLTGTGMQLKNEFSAFEASRVCYELALEVDPDNATTHNNCALLLWVCLNEAVPAAEEFKQSMELEPDDGLTCGNYAHLLAQTMNDPEQALVRFEEAVRLSPNDGGIPGNFAALSILRRDLAKAWDQAERSMRLCLPYPDRIMARPLFCAAALLLLQGRDASVPFGQLKTLFTEGILHVPWVLTATAAMLGRELDAVTSRLMTAILHAICDKSGLKSLIADPTWSAITPVALDTPWPPYSLDHASGV